MDSPKIPTGTTIKNFAPGFKAFPALVLDLDGTVRRSKSGQVFIQGPDDVELIPGMDPIIKQFRDNKWLILGITNQAGVAHGFKSPRQISEEIIETQGLFSFKPAFDGIKACLFDEKGSCHPFNYRSVCRKPMYGALALFESEFFGRGIVIDWDKSLFVGDRPEDEECAKSAGITFISAENFLATTHSFTS